MRNRTILFPLTSLIGVVAYLVMTHISHGIAALNILSQFRETLNTLKASGASEAAINQEWATADKLYEPLKSFLFITDVCGVVVIILLVTIIILRLSTRTSQSEANPTPEAKE